MVSLGDGKHSAKFGACLIDTVEMRQRDDFDPHHCNYARLLVQGAVGPGDAITVRRRQLLPHLAAARAHGIEPMVLRLQGIGLDIDQPEDLRAFLQALPPMNTRALMALRDTSRRAVAGEA